MKKDLSLVILAAGMGSRYGGLKQIDPMTKEGDTIIDFSIYDAIEAGFTKVVFIIREHFKVDFKKHFNTKLKGKIDCVYVCQEVAAVPKKYLHLKRQKPWGTAHALLMAKKVITTNFVVINADDYYGKNNFKELSKKLLETATTSTQFYVGGYLLENTISDFGTVSRGHCFIDEHGFLEKIIERTSIRKTEGTLFYEDTNNNQVAIKGNTIVSMNFWGFTPQLFLFLEAQFEVFLKENSAHLTKEFFIPSVVDFLIKNKKTIVKVLQNNDKWLGVTYPEDKEFVVKEIATLKAHNVYPKNLW